MDEGKGVERHGRGTGGTGPRPRRVVVDYLVDILSSIEKIDQYMAGVGEEQFYADSEKRDAVSHRLEIIGEAAKHIPKAMRDKHPDIPWSAIVGMRNVLTHAYHDENPTLLWRTVQIRLAPLREVIHDLLNQEGNSPDG
ncbi:MAG: HepT-like ribonuclease domain-containing protein [Chloroflexota bacterium]